MRDWKVGKNTHTDEVSIAQAVAASSAFPPVLAPATFEFADSDFTPGTGGQGADNLQRATLYHRSIARRRRRLRQPRARDCLQALPHPVRERCRSPVQVREGCPAQLGGPRQARHRRNGQPGPRTQETPAAQRARDRHATRRATGTSTPTSPGSPRPARCPVRTRGPRNSPASAPTSAKKTTGPRSASSTGATRSVTPRFAPGSTLHCRHRADFRIRRRGLSMAAAPQTPRSSTGRPGRSDPSWTVLAQDPSISGPGGKALTTQVRVPAERLERGPRDTVCTSSISTRPANVYQQPRARTSIGLVRIRHGHPEAGPQSHFHQQNVYAIAMSRARRLPARARSVRSHWGFASRRTSCKVAPHAFADANAYYSRESESLSFGYFPTAAAA